MLEKVFPSIDDYHGVNGHPRALRRFWSPDSPPAGFVKRGRQRLKPGDLVCWSEHPDERTPRGWVTPLWKNKWTGVVLLTRWVWADWADRDTALGRAGCKKLKKRMIYPEALILWEDNDTTNTSQSCLKKLKLKDYDKVQERRRTVYEGS